jgi:molybdate/tungstate transport system substrate-binding protein
VSLLAAGSLQLALSKGLADAVDVPVQVESRGSAAAARLVAAGKRDPDVVSVADTALFESILRPSWHAVFASNAVVLAYDREAAGGRRIEDTGREGWYRPLLDGDVALGRTDPDQDPLGYRTLFALELASRYYDAAGLRDRIPAREQIYPETSLLSRFETGALDAAFVYRNMAVERGYDYVALPSRIDLSAPEHVEEWYSTVSYTLPSGASVRGDLIGYGSTVRHRRDPVLDVFEAHVAGDYLADHGFVLPDGLPRYEGDVPDALA